MKYPKVFVIILNYNGGDVLRKCLDDVYKENYTNKEVIVVDNNSTDGSFDEIKRIFPRFYIIRNSKNIGFAAGNNVAIKLALEKMADYILLLNNDAFLEKDTLEKMVDAAEKNKNCGIFSPVIYDDKNQIWFSGGKIEWFKMRAVHERDLKKTDFVTGCAMFIRKEVFKKIGLLDENFFLYYEDADFSYRAQKAGFGLKIVSEARVFHLEKSSINPDKIYHLVLSGIRFFRKNTHSFMRIYIEAYILFRKIKNWLDLKKFPDDQEKKMVKKAYLDAKN